MNERQERLRSLAAGIQSRVSGKLSDLWWAFMLRGVFAGGLGIGALLWPTLSLAILTRLIGLYCLADGATGLAGVLRASDRGPRLLQAIVSLGVGGVLLLWPEVSTRTLLMVFGAWALFTGVSQLLATRQADADIETRGPITTVGVTAVVVGLVLLLWPGTGVVTIAWVIAVAALLLAGLLIFLALRLKQLKARVDNLTSLP